MKALFWRPRPCPYPIHPCLILPILFRVVVVFPETGFPRVERSCRGVALLLHPRYVVEVDVDLRGAVEVQRPDPEWEVVPEAHVLVKALLPLPDKLLLLRVRLLPTVLVRVLEVCLLSGMVSVK